MNSPRTAWCPSLREDALGSSPLSRTLSRLDGVLALIFFKSLRNTWKKKQTQVLHFNPPHLYLKSSLDFPLTSECPDPIRSVFSCNDWRFLFHQPVLPVSETWLALSLGAFLWASQWPLPLRQREPYRQPFALWLWGSRRNHEDRSPPLPGSQAPAIYCHGLPADCWRGTLPCLTFWNRGVSEGCWLRCRRYLSWPHV